MKKISTLFKKDPNNLKLVINEINSENEWVFKHGIATRKFNGTAAAIIDGILYKRYDAKKGKNAPKGAIPCQEADIITGHHPHWVKCEKNKPEDKYFFEGFNTAHLYIFGGDTFINHINLPDGTYELCGEKIRNNTEKITGHILIKHGQIVINLTDLSFDGLKTYLSNPENDIEGIVFHHKNPNDGRMCKIRKSDFGIKR